MLRRFTFVALLVVPATLAARPALAGPKPPPPTCADLLGTNIYSCIGTIENETQPASFCIEGSATTGEEQFDILFNGGPLSCNCNPTGSGKKLKFRSSRHAFMCTGGEADLAITGKVTAKGAKITKGLGLEDGVLSFIFSCKLDPTCTNTP